MKKTFMAVVAAFGMASSAIVIAAERPKFDYVSAQYQSQDLDGGSWECTQDGLSLNGSLAIDEQIYIGAGASDVSGDGCGSQVIRVLGGIRSDYGTASVLYFHGSLFNMDIDRGDSGLGYGIAGGIRTFIDPGIEAYGQLSYDNVDIDNVDLGLTLAAGIVYDLKDGLALTGELAVGSENDARQLAVGVRYKF